MKTVCVVGLGPAGLSVVKELREAGLSVVAFDGSSRVGGRWSLDPSRGVWKELCLNSTRRSTAYSCFEWKDDKYPTRDQAYAKKFPHNTEVQAYLDDYAKQFGLMPSIRLKTTVVQVERQTSGGWIVTTQDRSGKKSTHNCDGLVVCSGRFIIPRNPLLDDALKNFTGSLVHSKDFRSIGDYKEKKVVVVGSSISGGDISSNLARNGDCKKVINSVRHIPYVLDKVSPVTSLPLDEFLWQRLPVWLARYLPASFVSKGLQSAILEQYPSQLQGPLKPDDDIRKAGITLSIDYVKTVNEGKLSIQTAIASSDGSTLTFADGTKEGDVDVVIAATGYEVDLSYLPSDIQDAVLYTAPFSGAKEVALYKHTLVPGIE